MLGEPNYLSLSLEKCLSKVKFNLPKVVQKQKAKSYQAVFIYLYQVADTHGMFELDAQAIVVALGISERAVYYALRFLKRVNLLTLEKSGRGRGNCSIYKLNWLKSANLSIKDIKAHTTYDGPAIKRLRSKSGRPMPSEWGKKLKAFRELLEHSWLLPSEQKLCLGVLGRHLKPRTVEYARELYNTLAAQIHKLDAPNWVMTIHDLCRWFMGILKSLAKIQVRFENLQSQTPASMVMI